MDGISIADSEAVVFTKNNCVNCDATKDLMDELNVSYRVINMDENPEAKAAMKKLNMRQAPVVMTASTRWSGFKEQEIRDFAAGDDVWG